MGVPISVAAASAYSRTYLFLWVPESSADGCSTAIGVVFWCFPYEMRARPSTPILSELEVDFLVLELLCESPNDVLVSLIFGHPLYQ